LSWTPDPAPGTPWGAEPRPTTGYSPDAVPGAPWGDDLQPTTGYSQETAGGLLGPNAGFEQGNFQHWSPVYCNLVQAPKPVHLGLYACELESIHSDFGPIHQPAFLIRALPLMQVGQPVRIHFWAFHEQTSPEHGALSLDVDRGDGFFFPSLLIPPIPGSGWREYDHDFVALGPNGRFMARIAEPSSNGNAHAYVDDFSLPFVGDATWTPEGTPGVAWSPE